MRQLQLLSLLFALFTFAAAWPWPEENAAGPILDVELNRRQNDGSSNSDSSSPSSSSDRSSKSSSPTTTNSDSSASTNSDSSPSSSNGKSASDSGKKTTSKATKTTGKSAKTTDFDPRLPAGGISMITPAALSGAEYYKIGDWVTFAWNYTSLSVTPSKIDVLASCSANQATYTLALNQTVHPTGEVLWDTGAYQQTATVPLLTETYTLIIYDAASSISATPRSGYLGVFDQWTFGMYVPQKYTPLSSFECATCGNSGAMSIMERQTLGFLFGMAGITVLTFTWFASSFGVF